MRAIRSLAALLAVALLALAAFGVAAHAEETRLVLLHTTDLHGSLTAWDDLTNRAANRGLTRLATIVDTSRAAGLPLLLLDAGDTIEGPGIETFHAVSDTGSLDPMMLAMTRMGYDAMAVGNHEFDFGRPALERARRQASFPWLAANILNANGNRPFNASVVKTVGGIRVGIVGLCTPAVPFMTDPANIAGLRFESPVDAATSEVTRLRMDEHCDVVVLLAHTGLERDTASVTAARLAHVPYSPPAPDENWGYRLATQVPGVDVVLLGHTHTTVGTTVGGVVIAQAGRSGEGLGRVELTLARAATTEPWRVTRRFTTQVAVRGDTRDQAAVAEIAAPYRDATRQAFDRAVGTCTGRLAAPNGRLADSPLWELIHRAQLEATGADVSLAALYTPEAAIPAGPVTVRQLMRLYPYNNTLGVVKLTGAQLRDVLEYAASLLAPYTYEPGAPTWSPGASAANFDAAKGVTYEIDLARPEGDRIVGLARRGAPLADGESLTVAVNSYRENGGGGYPWLAKAPRVWATDRRIHELLADYAAKHPLTPEAFAPGWRIRPEFVATPERPLVERLVAHGVLTKDAAHDFAATTAAKRGDVAYWIARAFDWREAKRSNAFADVPDSLAPWLDGLMRRKVLGADATMERLRPFSPMILPEALDWCERAARSAGYTLAPALDSDFRRGLLTGTGIRDASAGDTLTGSQMLGLIANLRYPRLRILETTDFHGAILAGSRDRRSGRQLGGSAVLAAWVAKLTAENPYGTVLIDGGDCFQGTMISNLQFGRPVVEQMNAMRYTAMAIGNHEFDWSADTLARRVQGMRFAALGANMTERKSHRRPKWVRADTVVTRLGQRLGVFGMCYDRTPTVTLAANVAHLSFEDDSATAARLVPLLARRADLVIGVGHIPAESDSTRAARSGNLPRLARGIPGVAAWFGGHSHNLVSDRVNGIPVMIAGSHGEAVAVCDLTVDPVAHRVVDSRYELVRTWADEVTPDSAMAARVLEWNAEVAPIAAMHVGENAKPLRRNRGGQNDVGCLVSDAIRAASGADIALQNTGGLRADLDAGEITKGSVYEVMPFDNQIFLVDLTGAEVRLAIEQALRRNRATQVSGIRYVYDSSRPALDQVTTITDERGVPLDPAKTYRVAMNDFMATGGDSYDALAGGKNRVNTQRLIRDALEVYIKQQCATGPLDYAADGRVTRTGATDAP